MLNVTTTDSGYYTQDLKAMDPNWTAYVMVALSIEGFADHGLPDNPTLYYGKTIIDYVRVYARDECTDDVVIPNPIIFPYENLNERTITIGTQGNASQSNCGPTGTNWQNIAPRWNGHYTASAITMLPNFETYPAWHTDTNNDDTIHGHWNSFLYDAKFCPEHIVYDTSTNYVDTFTDVPDTTVYDCDITQADLDEVDATGDSDLISRVYFILDSLGCDTVYANRPVNNNSAGSPPVRKAYSIKSGTNFYVPNNSLDINGQNKRVNDNAKSLIDIAGYNGEIFLYPNPTRSSSYLEYYLLAQGNVTINLTNALGQNYSSYIEPYSRGQQLGKNIVRIHSESLAPGIYYCYITIGTKTTTKKLTVY
jgi:hypothetical protein